MAVGQAPEQTATSLPDTPPVVSIINHLLHLTFITTIGLTPLLFSELFSELFEFPKMVAVYALTLIAVGLTVTKWLLSRRLDWPRTPLDLPILAFVLIYALATITSIHPYTSLVGYHSRFDGGFLSYLSYIILFYVIVLHLVDRKQKTEKDRRSKTRKQKSITRNSKFQIPNFSHLFRFPGSGFQILPATSYQLLTTTQRSHRLLWTWLLSASIVALWAILEHFGYSPSCLILRGELNTGCWVEDVQARVFATLGQPNWLATYLVAALPLGVALILTAHRRRTIWLAWTATLLIYAAFWYTYSRSGWIGLGVASVVLAMCLPWSYIWQRRVWLTGLIIACAFVSLTSLDIAALRVETSLAGTGTDSSTGHIRLLVWQGTLELIKQHPFLGTGPGTFAYGFLAHRPVAMNNTTEWNFLYNEAHNEVLNMAVSAGVLGLIAWLSIFVTAGIHLWKQGVFINLHAIKAQGSRLKTQNNPGIRNQESSASSSFRLQASNFTNYQPPAGALAAGIAGVFAAQLLGFSVVITNLLLCIALAILIAPSSGIRTISLNTPVRRYTVVALTLLCLLPATYCLLRYVAAEYYATQASSRTGPRALASYYHSQRAVELNPLEPTYRTYYAYALAALGSRLQGKDRLEYLQQAHQQAQHAIQQNPHNQLTLKLLVNLYRYMADLDLQYREDWLQAAKASYALAPTDPVAAQSIAEYYLEQKSQKQTLRWVERLHELRPHGAETYYTRARLAAILTNDEKEARKLLEQALTIRPNYPEAKAALEALNPDN